MSSDEPDSIVTDQSVIEELEEEADLSNSRNHVD